MNQPERVDGLLRNGWRVWKRHENGWITMSRFNRKEVHSFLNPSGHTYLTVFNQGRIATGIIKPRPRIRK